MRASQRSLTKASILGCITTEVMLDALFRVRSTTGVSSSRQGAGLLVVKGSSPNPAYISTTMVQSTARMKDWRVEVP